MFHCLVYGVIHGILSCHIHHLKWVLYEVNYAY
jgi:hypothetical protein